MHKVVSPYVPFPNLFWWSKVADADTVVFDTAEHFEKMTYRNRYYITGANGRIQLSVPLSKGRNQRTAMCDVLIDQTENWQQTHLRTIKSVYGRAAFFDYYVPELEALFNNEYVYLTDFSKTTILWLKKHLGAFFEFEETEKYQPVFEDALDLRKNFKPNAEKKALRENEGVYYQLFQERNGFLPNLSLLDMLFSEGPGTMNILKEQKRTIAGWLAIS